MSKRPKTRKHYLFFRDCIGLQRLGLVACLFYGCTSEAVHERSRPCPVSGTLALSGFVAAADVPPADATPHMSLLVPGLDYAGMQDNVQFSARVDEIRRELGRPLPEQPSAYTREIRRSIKRDILRKIYRVLGR